MIEQIAARANEERLRLIDQYDGTGEEWCLRHTLVADQALREAIAACGEGAEIAVAAVGGYGRRELGPHSDLDFVFLADEANAAACEERVRQVFKAFVQISDAVGWDIDYALRYPSDAPGLDDKSRTALLDARLVAGSESIYARFLTSFMETLPTARFLSDKRRERLESRRRHGYTPRRVEVHLRDGAGGLRDYQATCWFAKVLNIDPDVDLREAYDFLLRVRNALHIATDRKEDKLVRTRHSEVAGLLGLEPQRMFNELMRSAEAIQEGWRDCLRVAQRTRFTLANGVVAEDGKCRITDRATLSEAASGVCRAVDLDIAIVPARLTASAVGDGPTAVGYLTRGPRHLRALDRSGVLPALCPEFDDARYLLPDDSVHEFTVGEHTLKVVDNLESLKSDPHLSTVWDDADNRVLCLGALLHDVGKIDSELPHSVAGERVARQFGQRMGLQPKEIDAVAWLVREHLTMAKIARTHDLQMPEAPMELARVCGDRQKLATLYLLTIADITSVSEQTYTQQVAASLRELYDRTNMILDVDDMPTDAAIYRNAALEGIRELSGDDAWLEIMPTHYLLGTPRENFRIHGGYVKRAREGKDTIVFENDLQAGTTEVTICCHDSPKPGLLSRILGAIYAHDLSVHSVRAASTIEEAPIALDQIVISFRRGLVPKNLSSALSSSLAKCVAESSFVEELLLKHNKDPHQPQHLLDYKLIPGEPASLEVETPIGRGMPYRVTKMLAHFGWHVYVARMGQWAGRAVARFYLTDPRAPLTEGAVREAIESYRLATTE